MKQIPIPKPNLESWMHKRIRLQNESKEQWESRFNSQNFIFKIADNFLYRLLQIIPFHKSNRKWAFFKIGMEICYIFFKIHNRIEIKGIEKVPKKGAIFIMNHLGAQDPIIFLSSFYHFIKEPCGIFTDVGNGFIADMLEKKFNFVTRRGKGPEMIEKMIQTILIKTKYFAIWPEGHPPTNNGSNVGEGFSGIVKVYTTLNSDKNRIPIVPIIMQGAETFWWGERRPAKKIILTYKSPYYLPRQWLKKPEDGGKSPREIIDHIMIDIARYLGQNKLIKNHLLHRRRKETKEGKPWWN